MRFRLSGIVNDSIVDGPGLRLTVFMQGCPYGCPGCHNPQTHDVMGGREADTEEVRAMLKKNPLLDGLTLSGGEPLLQPQAACEMAEMAKAQGLNVWCYTGDTVEHMLKTAPRTLWRLLNTLMDWWTAPLSWSKNHLICASGAAGNKG